MGGVERLFLFFFFGLVANILEGSNLFRDEPQALLSALLMVYVLDSTSGLADRYTTGAIHHHITLAV